MSKHYEPVSPVTAADINRVNRARWGGGEATFSDSAPRATHDADREITGKVVLVGGKWFYRKPNDALRYGPFDSASEAAEEARRKGVRVDSETHDSLSESEEREYRRLSNTSNRTSEEQRRLAELSRKKAVSEYGDSRRSISSEEADAIASKYPHQTKALELWLSGKPIYKISEMLNIPREKLREEMTAYARWYTPRFEKALKEKNTRDSEGTEALRNGLNEFLAEEEQEPEHEMQ